MTTKTVMFWIFFVLFFFYQCEKQNTENLFKTEVKFLEYQREVDSKKWEALFLKASSINEKRFLTLSASYIKSNSLLPFFINVFKESSDDSLKKLTLFGIGNCKTPEAEQLLLDLPFDSLSMEIQNTIIEALGQCCSQKSFPRFQQLSENSGLKKTLLKSLALCARRNISTNKFKYSLIDTSLKQNVTVEEAYYLLYAAGFEDIPLIIKKLPLADSLAKKYLLKSLFRKAASDSARFFKYIRTDSVLNIKFHSEILHSVNNKNNWRVQLAAVNLCPYTADSIMVVKLKPVLISGNIHVQIAAWKVFGQCFPDMLSSELLKYLPETKNQFHLRAELFNLLAHSNPQLAYRLIMQELSEGDSFYKARLLAGLCKTKLPQAVRTIRQFLNVSDARLVNTAFECLAELKRLRRTDYDVMFNSADNSTIAIGIEKAGSSVKLLSNSKLLELFKKFSLPQGLDVQRAIISSLKERSFKPDSLQGQFLIQHSSHPFVLNEMSSALNIKDFAKPDLISFLPDYLKPDSIKYYTNNPVVEIKTNKGIIKAVLYAEQTPLTTNNFLWLAQKSFYDNLTFHRVVPDFVIQGGDPLGDGWGGPDYLIPSEDNPIPYRRGSIGMATAGFDTGGSQFFICQSEQPHLTGNYTLFGHVTSGMDVVDCILPGDKILGVKLIN